jgi:hypothetical protein
MEREAVDYSQYSVNAMGSVNYHRVQKAQARIPAVRRPQNNLRLLSEVQRAQVREY